jgi:hypothetical protein
MVRALATVLQRLVTEIATLSRRIEHTVAELPDGQIVMSFPRAGRICAAQMLAELGDVRERFTTADQLAAEAGVCPVTHASGKSRGVVFRWACNHRLRAAVTCFADNSRHDSAWAAHTYKQARARGCDHPHAIRILARAWIRVLWRAWQDGKTYNPQTHNAAVNTPSLRRTLTQGVSSGGDRTSTPTRAGSSLGFTRRSVFIWSGSPYSVCSPRWGQRSTDSRGGPPATLRRSSGSFLR